MTGAAFDGGPAVLFSSSGQDIRQAEVSFPALHWNSLLLTGLSAESIYELSFSGLNVSYSPDAPLPGVLKDVLHLRANAKGVLRIETQLLTNLRLRIAAV